METKPAEPEKPAPKRSCNRHVDCDEADRKAKERGSWGASHCNDDCCEDCFGQ